MKFRGFTSILLPVWMFACESEKSNPSIVGGPIPDPESSNEWWFQSLQISGAWKYATGAGVKIAVCDCGYHTSEPEIETQLEISRAHDFSDIHHPDQINDGQFVFHGTSTASMIAAKLDQNGMNGIAFRSVIVPLQYFNFDHRLDRKLMATAISDCILYAAAQDDIRLILVQATAPGGTIAKFPEVYASIQKATAMEKIVIIPAGNEGIEIATSEKSDAIVVGALKKDNSKSHFSNYGAIVDISGYGEGVNMIHGPNGQIGPFLGSSAAAAQVTGAIALMLEINPYLSSGQIRNALSRTAERNRENANIGGQIHIEKSVKYIYDSL